MTKLKLFTIFLVVAAVCRADDNMETKEVKQWVRSLGWSALPNQLTGDRNELLRAAKSEEMVAETRGEKAVALGIQVKLGDKDAIQRLLAMFRSDKHPRRRDAFMIMTKVCIPALIVSLESDLVIDEPAGEMSYPEGIDYPRSTLAALVITSTIAKSGAFSQPVSTWADSLKIDDATLFRSQIRMFVAENAKLLADKQYGAATVPR